MLMPIRTVLLPLNLDNWLWFLGLTLFTLALTAARVRWGDKPKFPRREAGLLGTVLVALAFTTFSTAWTTAERVWVSVIVVTVLSVTTLARQVRDISADKRIVLAAGGFVLLALGILLGDVPGREQWRTFMADRALLSGFITSALLIGLGYLAVDAQVERQRARRAARLRVHAFDQIAWHWRLAVAVNDLTVRDPKAGCTLLGHKEEVLLSRAEASRRLVDAMNQCAGEVAVWIGILSNLADDDSERTVQLLAQFRRVLVRVIAAYEEADWGVRPRTNEVVKAGLLLEELRYLTAQSERRTRLKDRPESLGNLDHALDSDLNRDADSYIMSAKLLPTPNASTPGTLLSDTYFHWFSGQKRYRGQAGEHLWADEFGTFAEGAVWWRLADRHIDGHRSEPRICVAEQQGQDWPRLLNDEIAASARLKKLRSDAASLWKDRATAAS